MAVEMAIWRMTADGPVRLQFSPLELEKHLEAMITSDPSLIGSELLVIGRQVWTVHGGYVDVLALDSDARVHVIELKRDRTPRDVVAQLLDYGSWARGLTLEEVKALFSEHNDVELDEAFAETFDTPLPDVFNPDQQLTVVASTLDAASDRIVQYLAEQFGVPVNAVFFRHFEDGEARYLARTWLIPPDEAAATQERARRSKVRPWNRRDFYVILGNTENNDRWELAREYGVLNAGGKAWYWRPLRNLRSGHRVFAYVGGAGYVGVANVIGEMAPLRELTVDVDGNEKPLLELPKVSPEIRDRALREDEESTEYGVPVRWLESRLLDDAVNQRGLFASQVTACKLRDERTIEVLTSAFGVDDRSP